MANGTILLSAGGTGGHLFPAEALAHELVARGWRVDLATDDRASRYADAFPAGEIHLIASANPGGHNPVRLAGAAWKLWSGYRQSRALLKALTPALVAGFGGYPTLPPLLAAQRSGVPSLIHDANAVMGRTNRLLAKRANLIAMGFEGAASDEPNLLVTGNPVRPPILEAARQPYQARSANDPFHLLVFGGSQGAQFFSQVLPAAIDLLKPALQNRLKVVHQARADDEGEVASYYRDKGIVAQVAPFFPDMANHLANAHLVICRAGASTVSELSVIGRPAILVPYPFALDHDQALNAAAMARDGGARIVEQAKLSAEELAKQLENAMDDPAGLAKMAEKAKRSGQTNAAGMLADCCEHVARGGTGADFRPAS